MGNSSFARLTCVCLVLVMGFSTISLTAARADTPPSEVIDSYAKKVVSTLRDTDLSRDRNFEPLRQKLYNQLEPIIDFRLMTRSALGPHARSINQEQLQKLTDVFQPLVIRLYTDQLFEYLVMKQPRWVLDDIVVQGEEIRGDGSYAMVKTTAKVHREETKRDLAMNFKMYKQDGKWLVYDLVFEGISMVENYRSQFTSVLANKSVDVLIEQLRGKLESVREKTLQERVEEGTESSQDSDS